MAPLGLLRTTAVSLVLAATVALVAGCGDSSPSSTGSASVAARTAQAFASEVNLRADDVPGLKIVFGAAHGRSGPLKRQTEECDGGPLVSGVAHGLISPVFQKQKLPVQTVLSAVFLMRDPSTALGYIAAADSSRGLGCIKSAEHRPRVSESRIEVTALRPPLSGAPVSGVRVWRCLASLHACQSQRAKGFTDRLWFAAGPYVVMLALIAGPSNKAESQAAVELTLERHLLAALYSRAEAHSP